MLFKFEYLANIHPCIVLFKYQYQYLFYSIELSGIIELFLCITIDQNIILIFPFCIASVFFDDQTQRNNKIIL